MPVQFFIMSHTEGSSSESQATALPVEGLKSKLLSVHEQNPPEGEMVPSEDKFRTLVLRFDGTGDVGSLS